MTTRTVFVRKTWRLSVQVVAILLLLFLYSLCGSSSFSLRSIIVSNPRQLWLFRSSSSSKTPVQHTSLVPSCPNDHDATPHIIFPGGGIFFYWQAGVVSYLREQHYDFTNVTFCGASAGALTATLTSCNVDFVQATELALQLAHQANVWDRPLGLQGVWGPMIYDWLNELIPKNEDDDALQSILDHSHRLSLLITPFPSLRKVRVSKFHDRDDLIACNMASIHLPLFLDGRWTRKYRGRSYIDGSFLSKKHHYLPQHLPLEQDNLDHASFNAISLDYWNPSLNTKREHGRFDFVKAVSPKGIWGLLEEGMKDAKIMEEMGNFSSLSKFTDNSANGRKLWLTSQRIAAATKSLQS